ncbi:MAG: DUF4249 domain-containing protein [Bacteroidales bacterium]|nr:DUF4249 domain-containing protein [Bacteroidales bacterium]
MKRSLLIVLFFLLFISCEKAINWNFDDNQLNTIVVDGIITNVRKAHVIRITKPVSSLNEKPKPVTGAVVSLYNGDFTDTLKELGQIKGLYYTDTLYRAVLNKTYRLRVEYEGKRYEAFARMIPVTPFRKLSYAYDESKNMFYIDSVAESFNSKESAMYEIILDWSHLPEYQNLPLIDRTAIVYYYTLKTIDISQVFAPEKERVYFPAGTRILERKYSLAPRYADFIRSLLSETEWRGGYFDVSEANVHSNISNGGLGFFAVCTVTRDTLTVR